jgi:hypothetical protein
MDNAHAHTRSTSLAISLARVVSHHRSTTGIRVLNFPGEQHPASLLSLLPANRTVWKHRRIMPIWPRPKRHVPGHPLRLFGRSAILTTTNPPAAGLLNSPCTLWGLSSHSSVTLTFLTSPTVPCHPLELAGGEFLSFLSSAILRTTTPPEGSCWLLPNQSALCSSSACFSRNNTP